MGECGRAVRFQWSDSEVSALGDEASISIGEFTNTYKKYVCRLGHLKNVLRIIERKNPIYGNEEIPSPNRFEEYVKSKEGGAKK